jgi:head-tail adaptor
MPQLLYKKRKYPMPCLGDLIHRVIIYDRTIKAPESADEGNYTLDYSKKITVWAGIESVVGVVIFDSVNMDKTITHKMIIRYLPFITQEHWIKYDQQYFDIVRIEDMNNEKRFQILYCNVRGSISKLVNEA